MTIPTPPGTALRAAVIDALKADADLIALVGPRVLNRVPSGTPFPYLVVSNSAKPWDTTGDRGHEHTLQIHVQGQVEGDKQGETIFYACALALRAAALTLSAHRLINLTLEFEDVRSEEDGKRYFGLQRWRAVTEEL